MRWIDDYMAAHLDRELTAADLYGARCGIVHTYGPASDLSRKGEAKTVIYRWRVGHRPDDPLLEAHAHTSFIIEIERLAEALDKAVADFQVRIDSDSDLKTRVESNITGLLCYEPWTPIVIQVAEEEPNIAA